MARVERERERGKIYDSIQLIFIPGGFVVGQFSGYHSDSSIGTVHRVIGKNALEFAPMPAYE